jgi:hypothetical protein
MLRLKVKITNTKYLVKRIATPPFQYTVVVSFISQSIDRIESGGPVGGIESEEDADTQ